MEFFTKETPAKVMSLLGVSLASMAMLFSVTVYDASFQGTHAAVADPFGPASVMKTVDHVASGYSKAVYALVVDPVSQDFAMAADNIAWIGSNAKDGALAMLHIDSGSQAVETAVASVPGQGTVAGAYTEVAYEPHSMSLMDSLFYALGME